MGPRLLAVVGSAAFVSALLATTALASTRAERTGAFPAWSALGEVAPLAVVGAEARVRALDSGVSSMPSETQPSWACPTGACEAIVDPPAVRAAGRWWLPGEAQALQGGGVYGGFDPKELQSAYDIPVAASEARQRFEEAHTIAVVEAGGDPTAESDLATYRKQYELGPCTHGDGCFREVNQDGEEANLPSPEGWGLETSIDLDMASTACPHCRLLLVEAGGAGLAESVNTAARLGATEISNSYGVSELAKERCKGGECHKLDAGLNHDYDHPGVVITASAGDGGYDNYLETSREAPLFPAVSPDVIAVGGTSLKKKGGAWSESVWWEPKKDLGTGSGCSEEQPKPPWQSDSGCAYRTDNDVAAVAACESPVSVYSSEWEGWVNACGTSVSAPLVAGIEAHAGETGGTAVPTADAFYQDRGSLYDVSKGRNGTCSPSYLCDAEAQVNGYDGPAGNGTPTHGTVAVAGEPPSSRTEPLSGGTLEGETLEGVLDPNGLPTSYRFEYGTSTSYGSSVPVGEASAGSGTRAVSVSATLAGLAPGTYHYRLVATNSDGRSYGEDELFDTAAPSVTAVKPDSGWEKGGMQVRITGTNFVGGGPVTVRFGSVEATNVQVFSETAMEVTAPAGEGTVDVTVENANGRSLTSEADRFTYELIPPPAVSALAPSAGLSSGGTEVTITGGGFIEVSAVDFGSTPATSFEVLSETEIEALAPPGAGTAGVSVTTPKGTSASGAADEFSFEAPGDGGAWLAPLVIAEKAPGPADNFPRVALDGHGDALALWPSEGLVEVDERPAGGSWGAPVRRSKLELWGVAGADLAQIAFDERGDAIALLTDHTEAGTGGVPPEETVLLAAFRPAGGSWQKAVVLSHGCLRRGYGLPQLAVDDAGDAIASWSCAIEGNRVVAQTAYLPAGGNWQAPVTLQEAPAEGEYVLSAPNVALDSQGDAFAGWFSELLSGGRRYLRSEVAYRPAGGSWQAPTEIAENGGAPQLAVDGDGGVYALVGQPYLAHSVTYRPPGGGWQAPVEIASGALEAELAVDSQGDAVVVWQQGGYHNWVRAAYKPASASWQAPVTLFKEGYDGSTMPHVAFDAQGDAVASWNGPHGFETARLPAGHGWQAPVLASEIGGERSGLAMEADGNGFTLSLVPEGSESTTVEIEQYTLTAARVTGVQPDSGPATGGTAVTITGEHLGDATGVSFGSASARSFEVESETQIKALAPAGAGLVDVTVSTPEGTSVGSSADRFTYQAAPAVTTLVASTTQTTVMLKGTVDPEGLAVSDCHFEYGPTPAYGSSIPCSSLPGSGSSPVAVSASLSGLPSGSTYYFRVVASNADGTSYGAEQSFRTLPIAPTVITGVASQLAQRRATLNASADANEGVLSGCQFEYGASPALGKSVPCASLPSAFERSEPVSATVKGLSANTTYYFRIVASNAGGTTYGEQETFSTLAPEVPEIGACMLVAQASGAYTNAGCTKVSSNVTGAYEWEPWPLARDAFSAKGGESILETAKKTIVACHESVLAGEYTSSQTASLSLTFRGCEASGALHGPCQSIGASPGEITTPVLEAKLGIVKATAKPVIGWNLRTASETALATFTCEEQNASVSGSVIALVTPADETTASFSLKFKATRGKQKPEAFETGLKDTLTLMTERAQEQAGLTMSATISGNETPVEIKGAA